MTVSLVGIEPSLKDPEIFFDRRGAGIAYRVPRFGLTAGEVLCVTTGVGLYTAFSTWTDLPLGSLMRATDKQSATYEYMADGWAPVAGQFTGMINLGATRDLTASDNGACLFNQGGTSRTVTVQTSLPLRYSLEAVQTSSGTVTFAAGAGVTLVAASLVTTGAGTNKRLKRVDSTTFLVY